MPEGYYTDRNEAKLAPLRQEMQVALGNQLAKSGLAEGSPIFIRIFKLENTLEVWMEDKQDQGRYRLFQSFQSPGDPLFNSSKHLCYRAEGFRHLTDGN